MFGRKAKRIRELEYELAAEQSISDYVSRRLGAVKASRAIEQTMYSNSIRKITMDDLQVVFDSLERYRGILREHHFADPCQSDLDRIYRKYGITMNKNRMNSPV